MPRLRMKDEPVDVDAILKRERRERRRKRREEARHRTSDSMSPPRIRSTSTKPHIDVGFDESSVPPGQASQFDEADFAERLADAEAQDDGVGYFEQLLFDREASRRAAAFAYGGAAGVALGRGGANVGGDVVGAMDEEEYAEFVRAGMWRRKHKDEAERIEALDRERKRKAEQEEQENEKRRKVEKERIRKLEEKAKRRNKAEEADTRQRYDRAWALLLAQPQTTGAGQPTKVTSEATPDPAAPSIGARPLRFSDFAWPMYPSVPFPPLSWPATTDITPTTTAAFLLDHLPSDKKKTALRSAILAYHPDRFERLVQRIPEEPPELRERVRELGLTVSQTLNDLMRAGGEAS